MNSPVILVIDDSATIRKMVDSHLSQEGYRVVLAPTGEAGIQLAQEMLPDLILLDHQLPGTTGIEVCRKIIAIPECRQIPFVVSSTLRKQAYVEYMDVANVVDSLPKPFKPELLKMAVANALETASLIMSSQTNGTAVPEVVGGIEQPAFCGDLRWLSLREVLDFLNNGRKFGMLEVETQHNRVCFYLQHGRIQGVVSASFDLQLLSKGLPAALQDLAPLIPFTMSSGTSTQASGLVELMDKKMLDPRLLRSLLRHQAGVLTRYCFLNTPMAFSFLAERAAPPLLQKAGIDCSLAALLVDGALTQPSQSEPEQTNATSKSDEVWTRRALRGQNLDRTGLSARHVQLLSSVDAASRKTAELAAQANLPESETQAVLNGLAMADWIEAAPYTPSRTVIAYQPDPQAAAGIRQIIESPTSGWTGNVVRDALSLRLLLKRRSPQALLVALEGDQTLDLPPGLDRTALANTDARVALLVPGDNKNSLATTLQDWPVIAGPCGPDEVLQWLNTVAADRGVRDVASEGTSVGDAGSILRQPAPIPELLGAH